MKAVIVAGIIGGLASASLVAESPKEDPGKHRGGPPREKRDFFARLLELDEDQNGRVSFAEFSKSDRVSRLTEEQRRKLFDRLDKNKDGEIRRGEIARSGAGPRPGGGMRWKALDTNQDGKVSLEEFRKSPRMDGVPAKRQEEIFGKIDHNGDGFLDEADFRARRPDRPGGGRPSHRPKRGGKAFEELDADGDGVLSFEEFRQGPRTSPLDEDRQEDLFEQMDRDGSGTLDKNELLEPGRGPKMGPGDAGPGGSGKRPGTGKGPNPQRRGEDRPAD